MAIVETLQGRKVASKFYLEELLPLDLKPSQLKYPFKEAISERVSAKTNQNQIELGFKSKDGTKTVWHQLRHIVIPDQ